MPTVALVHSRYQMGGVLLFLLLLIWLFGLRFATILSATAAHLSGIVVVFLLRTSATTLRWGSAFYLATSCFILKSYSPLRSLTLPLFVTGFISLPNWFNLFPISLLCINNQRLPVSFARVFCPGLCFSCLPKSFLHSVAICYWFWKVIVFGS